MKKTLFLILIVLINLNIYTDELINKKELTLDVDTAVSLALANNLGLKAEKMKFESKKWSMFTSWNVFVPNISMSATMSRSNLNEDDRTQEISGVIPIPPTYDYVFPFSEEVTTPQWGVMANFNLSLSINAAMGFQVYQSVLDWQSGKLSLEMAKKQIERNVKKNLYNLILTEKSITLTEESINNAKKRYDQAVTNYKNGLISEYDMLSAEVSYKNLIPGLIGMKNGYATVLLSFKQMIGIKKDVVLTFNAKIESDKKSFDTEEMINKYIYENLDLAVFDYNVKSLINLRNMNISRLTPTFTFGFTADPTFQKDPLEDDWFGDKKYMDDNWKQRAGAFSFTLSIPLSTFVPFSKEQMDIVRGQLSIGQAKLNYDSMKQAKELEIESTVMSLDKSIESLEVLELNVKLAERAFKKAEEAYAAGSKELLEVQNSEWELNRAKLNALQEEYNYITGLLDLEYLTNTKL